ncbi:MAG: FAD-dependent oxidoreductase [Hyphomonadaceae bacterium]|nr:FAD-dependent oxidoreductase [Hyphomonadaceae bacterium]
MRVAVIGGGVSGLGAAWALRDAHDVVLFEKNPRLGGHAHTQTIDYDGVLINVDTGFIVYNDLNYPNLVALFDTLGVKTRESDMSFAVSDPEGFEWSSNGLPGLFAWKRNIVNPGFLRMLSDIIRFSTNARRDLAEKKIGAETLEAYVMRLNLGRDFLDQYLMPMGAAIWSTPEREMLRYPALSFLRFFDNHRLLHAARPQWRTVVGGSRTYVDAIAGALGARVRLATPVTQVTRDAAGVTVSTAAGAERFDQVVFACHSDEALALLPDADAHERTLLSDVAYAPNTAYLHRDASLMPKRAAAWGAWNYLRRGGEAGRVCVSYWMNVLQDIDRSKPLFVTLNPETPPDPALTFGCFAYDHPQFNAAALAAQHAIQAHQGKRHTWFTGAWLGYGFHEDGLASGLEVALRLGGNAPWAGAITRRDGVPIARAA